MKFSELLEFHHRKIAERNKLTRERVKQICKRIATLRHATKLWNCIDEMAEPEALWLVMLEELPWAFSNTEGKFQHCANSIKFTY